MAASPPRALVIGNSGGIGRALHDGLASRGLDVTGLARSATNPDARIDITSEPSVAAAADRLSGRAPFDLILLATGLLHGEGFVPEKSMREIDAAHLQRSFAVNAIGPALVTRHFLPLLPRSGRAVFGALSARVGSITDNRLGGWYAYRASKAALNMLIKTLAIELARTRPDAICVALHPGTVDTPLSQPFQRNVAAEQLLTPQTSAAHLLAVLDQLTPNDTGGCFDWNGARVAP